MPTASDKKIIDRVMPLMLERHSVAGMTGDRRKDKVAKLEMFVNRAIERGLTMKMVDENLAAGRPPHFVETGEA